MRQTIIGITTSIERDDKIRKGVEYTYVRREYGRMVRRVGAQPIYLDSNISPRAAAELCDGIIISGGEDIDPRLYGSEPKHIITPEHLDRTAWEMQLIEACDGVGTPILGICYGSQLLNVYYGGTLYQDIAIERESDMFHGSGDNQVEHIVTFREPFLGYTAYEQAGVASRHHQAVRDPAPGFVVIATADDGTIEAIAGKGHYGVQWHSESDSTYKKIYGPFVELCSPQQNILERLRSKATIRIR